MEINQFIEIKHFFIIGLYYNVVSLSKHNGNQYFYYVQFNSLIMTKIINLYIYISLLI